MDAPAGAAPAAAASYPTSSSAVNVSPNQRPRLHLTGLPADWNTQVAQAFFEPMGAILDCVIFKDQSTGKAKYGFLEFQELDAAVKTIEAYNGREVGGNTMAVGFAKPKGGAAPQQGGGGGGAQESSRLFVGNIGAGATVDEIRAVFGEHGTVTECTVWPNQKAHPRRDGSRPQAAFIQFTSASSAKAARDAMHLRPLLRGRELEMAAEEGESFRPTPPLIVDLAQRKPDGGAGGGGYNNGGGGGGSRYDDRDRGYGRSAGGRDEYRDDRRYDDRRGYGRDDYDRRSYDSRDDRRSSSGYSDSRRREDDYYRASSSSGSSSRRDDYDRGSSSRDYYSSSSSSRRDRSRSRDRDRR